MRSRRAGTTGTGHGFCTPDVGVVVAPLTTPCSPSTASTKLSSHRCGLKSDAAVGTPASHHSLSAVNARERRWPIATRLQPTSCRCCASGKRFQAQLLPTLKDSSVVSFLATCPLWDMGN